MHAVGVSPDTLVYDISNACLGVMNGIVDLANRIELGQILYVNAPRTSNAWLKRNSATVGGNGSDEEAIGTVSLWWRPDDEANRELAGRLDLSRLPCEGCEREQQRRRIRHG